MFSIQLADILNTNVYEVARRTPLSAAPRLEKRLNNRISLKREDLQAAYSFKVRGAFNFVSSLTEEERKRGIVAASAGNHAQGVALSCQHLNIDCTIVVPTSTPELKVENIEALGATVIRHGEIFDHSQAFVLERTAKTGEIIVPPFDDLRVITGQATLAMEILNDVPYGPDYLFVACGGGGLLAGALSYIKQVRPSVKVIGVEEIGSASMKSALDAGKIVDLDRVSTFAEGLATKRAGTLTYDVISQHVDDFLTVTPDEICAAMRDVFEATRVIAEPAGAAAMAGLKQYAQQHQLKDKHLIAVLSGANSDFTQLRPVVERVEIGDGRECFLDVKLPEERGAYLRLAELLEDMEITEFNYRCKDSEAAHVFVGILNRARTGATGSRDQAIDLLRSNDYQVQDLTGDDVTRYHIRHMIGGRSEPQVSNEELIAFEFTNRRQSALAFLQALGTTWNISLFHFHGSDPRTCRLLVGLTLPEDDEGQLRSHLDVMQSQGFIYKIVTDNPMYQMHLA